MIELEIPHELLEARPDGAESIYGLRIGDDPDWPHKPWVCFLQDIEKWIAANIKDSDLKIGHRWHPPADVFHSSTDWYFIQFADERDATLFKLWWL
jgi:hypothetical protein